MTRRGWATEAVGWAAALSLVLGAGTVVSGAVDPDPERQALAPLPRDVRVAVAAAVLPEPEPEPTPAPTRAARPEPVNDPDLGPPPGPFPDVTPELRAAPQDRYAFLVGMQDYRPPTKDTIASVADVVLIRAELLAAGWRKENIKVVTDEDATGEAIRRGMTWLAETSVPGRTFSFFHYSGHVKQFGGLDDALWPVDRDWVRDTEVARRLSAVPGRLWVDIAGCEGGSFSPGLASDRVLVTGSSKATEKSYEHPGWRSSVWTGLLFRTAARQADADRDGTVVMGEALRYSQYYAQVVTLVQEPYGRQTPQLVGDPVRGWTLDSPPA